MSNYRMFFAGPQDAVYALVANIDGNTVERSDGEWVPVDDDRYLDFDRKFVDRMDEGIVEFLDNADAENKELYRSDVEQFIVKAESE